MNKNILITGAAGFIGVNAAKYFKDHGFNVTGVDNLSRRGSEINKEFLDQENIRLIEKNVIDKEFLAEYFKNHDVGLVLHLSAQVAATSSIVNPTYDFENNLQATFNILESIRNFSANTAIIYASTNKVYGDLKYLKVEEQKTRFVFNDKAHGIAEDSPLDFHTPYGCSKGAADQYILDYGRTYGIKSVVFRQSCVYGVRQMGVEDQGWVAWLSYAAKIGKTIDVYGNGKQVRDMLYVEDLVKAYYKAFELIEDSSGNAFNIGGGPTNSLSILEYIDILSKKYSKNIEFKFSPKRTGDQDIFISNNSKVKKFLGWTPQTGYDSGISKMIDWQEKNFEILNQKIFNSFTIYSKIKRTISRNYN